MRKNISYCHPSFSLENVKGASNYKIIKSGRLLDLAYQLGAMTRRDCHVNNDNNSLSYVREADNKNLLAGELEKTFNLPHLNPLLSRRGFIWILCCLFSYNAYAVCTPTPDCASIGYTETSCETKSIKCPFDTSKLFVIPLIYWFIYKNKDVCPDKTSML